MNPVLDKLDKMIRLEIEAQYANRAVIGGLDGVLAWWPEQARQQCGLPAQRTGIDRVIELVRLYVATSDRQRRAQIAADIQRTLAGIDGAVNKKEVESGASAPQAKRMPAPASPPPAAVRSPKRTRSLASDDARLGLNSPVTSISGVGPTQAERLSHLQIKTIGDLLYTFPRRYDDYRTLKTINKLVYGEQVTVIGTVRSAKVKRTRGGATIVNVIVADASGALQATWFNQPYLARQFKRGEGIVLSGQIDEYLGRPVMSSPTWEVLEPDLIHTGRLVPVYPLTEGLRPRVLRRTMKQAVDYWTKRLPDHLPARIRERLGLMLLEDAVYQMHFPDSVEKLSAARRRLGFDEFLILQLGVLRQRQEWQSQPGISIIPPPNTLASFLDSLPYGLTGAQQRVLSEIVDDLAQTRPMSRLLQGDVGSGKTVIAAAAMLAVGAAGYQAALMAPTEILAEQHFASLSGLLLGRGLDVALLTGSVPQSEKAEITERLAEGEISLLIGTHAIIQENVRFKNLALAVIDEQHRFGVRQRGVLRGKGYNPHMLVMSATPIPRTLALTSYGDLDVSVIDEMPPGRQPIRTRWFLPAERERAYRFVRGQIEKGHQAYIICPLVQESDKIEARAAVEEHARLQESIFPDLRLGLLHGRLKSEEKERVMRQFNAHELDILVSTSVIEVGIDVPNATVMLIEGANRFGLSQLHQFRGRVGRGSVESYCILLADGAASGAEEGDVAYDRLRAIEETTDGFKLAEIDLEMRGPGDFFGTRQSGLPELKLASLGDMPLLEVARREAQALFEVDPKLSFPDHRLLARKVDDFWGGEGDLS